MIVHKNWIVNSALSAIIAVTCVVGDKKLQTSREQLSKSLWDNATHALVGFFTAIIVLTDQSDRLQLAAVCLIMSSVIDVDHLIAARSFKLADAINLPSRPFLHNSTIPLALIAVLIYCHFTSADQKLITWLIIIIVAFVTHHLRDANRRGLWFAPLGSTQALSDPIYIVLILLTPYLLKCFLFDTFKYSRVKTTILEV